MNELGPLHYLVTFFGAAVLTTVLVPVAMRVAIRHEVLDHPGGYKEQQSPVPYLGGVAIVVAFSSAVLAAALVSPPTSGLRELALIMGLGLALSAMGLLDDLRGLPAWPRLVVVVLAGVALWAGDVGVQLFDAPVPDALLTVGWLVGVTNSFNLLDNMDGLSAGLGAVAAVSFFLVAAVNGQFLVAALAAGLAGCALGFLRHNFHPARIYMGDAGSLYLGFLLAVLGIKLRFDAPREVTFLVPLVVLGLAVFDTTLVTVTRLLRRVSPFTGGRDHTSHRLVAVGLPVPVAVSLLYVGGAVLGWLALILSRLDVASAYLLVGLLVTLAAALGVALASVPVDQVGPRRRLVIADAPAPMDEVV